jgi:hypothetical protein
MNHEALKDVVRKLPADMPVHVAVQHAGVFTTITTSAAIALLGNVGPKWELTIRDTDEQYHAWISVNEGDGVGAYADPPTEDADGNAIPSA